MFNLEVAGNHDFFIGENAWLVHNCTPTAEELRLRRANTKSKAGVQYDADGYPMFDSLYDFTLPDTLLGPLISDGKQMSAGTRALREALKADSGLAEQMGLDSAQLSAIKSGKPNIPKFTWHHNQDGLTLELVDRSLHVKTPHSGGRYNTGGRP